jgi:hypothetical protein
VQAGDAVARTLGAHGEREAVDARATRRLYLWAFFTRASVGLLAYVLNEYFDEPFLEDALFYEDVGYSLASDWLSGRSTGGLGLLPPGAEQAWLIVAVIAVFYYILQGMRALPVLFVFYSAITAWVPCTTYRIARELGAPKMVAWRAAWLVALSPVFVFFSGTLYKEGLVLVILSVAAYHTLRLQGRWGTWSLLLVIGSVFALFALRFYLAIMMSLVITLGLVWGRRSASREKMRHAPAPVLIRQATTAVMFVALTVALGFHERAGARLAETPEGILVQIDTSREDMATSAYSGYLPGAEVSTPTQALRFFPIGLLHFLTVPLPWQWGRPRQNLVIAETAFWVLLYPIMILGIRRSLRANGGGTVFLGAVTGGMCIIYALLSGNVGTAYRMRSQVWLLWAPWAAWGWEVLREEWRRTTPVVRRSAVRR